MNATFFRSRQSRVVLVLMSLLSPGLIPEAIAQSSVQLYGQVDEWVGGQKLPGGKQSWQVSGGGMSTSYWGINGSEDLGNGVKAIFYLEDFFRASSGQIGTFQGDVFFSRNAYVGIEAPFGTITAGRLTTQLFVSTIVFNPFVDSYVFSPIVQHALLGLGTFPSYTTDQGVIGGTDWDNALQYSSPNFNGLSGNVMYALGGVAGQNGPKKYSGQFLYFHGPFAATGVYQYINYNSSPGDLGSLAAGLKGQAVGQLGASYDLKLVKFFAQYMYTKNDRVQGSWHVDTGQLGASVPVGLGSVMLSVAYSRDSGGLNQTRRSAAAGYDYPLSKRTDVYAAYLYDKFSGQSTGSTFGVGIRTKF